MDVKTLERYFYDTHIDSSVLSKYFRRSKVYQDAIIEPYESGRFYIFMTRPDMNLNVENLRAMDRIGQSELGDEILHNLVSQLYVQRDNSLSAKVNKLLGISEDPYLPKTSYGSFINLVTNLHKTAPIEDIVADAKTAFETYGGYGMVLGGHSKDSRSKGEFSITYNETKDLEIMKLHSIWNQYIDFASEGLVSRTKDNRDKHILDYASSLYVFAVEPDGETISFWAKFSGVIPLGVPWTSLGENLGDSNLITPTINYKYTYYEDNTLDILRDFTNLTFIPSYRRSEGQQIYKGKQWQVGLTTKERLMYENKQINKSIPVTRERGTSVEYSNVISPNPNNENTYQDPSVDPISQDVDNSFYKDTGYIYQDYNNVQIIKETNRYKLKFYGPVQYNGK